MNTIRVDLNARSYDIIIGSGVLGEAGSRIKPLAQSRRAIVVTDSAVGPLYAGRLIQSLEAGGIKVLETAMFPAGEGAKTLQTIEALASRCLQAGVDRKATVIALGGGVVGDIAGFLAAVLLRGIDFIQIPTTLMAQVDSSVGGKTGVNTPEGKNLIGAFYQPKLVLIDTKTLETLPRRELLSGYAEVVKYGLINDPAFFEWLEKNGKALLAGDEALQKQAIETSCRAKAAVVGRDETETSGERALLNLGHSFGHALEAIAGYDGSLLHGEAVSIGMAMAFDFSVRLGLCPKEDAVKVRRHLQGADLPVALPGSIAPAKMLDYMKRDKKAQNGQIKLVLVKGIGKAFQSDGVDEKTLLTFIDNYGQGK